MGANDGWMLLFAAAVGLLVGAWLALTWARRHQSSRLRDLLVEQQRQTELTAQLTAAQTRLQNEVEQTRASMKRQLAAGLAEPVAALARAEERLKAANEELDFLRRRPSRDNLRQEPVDDFAPTRPMLDSM